VGPLRFHRGDFRNLRDCEKACHNVDQVVHQAALGSVSRSQEDLFANNAANVTVSLNMLVAVCHAKVKSFTYAASSSMFGDHQPCATQRHRPAAQPPMEPRLCHPQRWHLAIVLQT